MFCLCFAVVGLGFFIFNDYIVHHSDVHSLVLLQTFQGNRFKQTSRQTHQNMLCWLPINGFVWFFFSFAYLSEVYGIVLWIICGFISIQRSAWVSYVVIVYGFRNAYNMVLHKFGEKLYSGLVTTMTTHLREISKSIKAAQGGLFLEELNRKWPSTFIFWFQSCVLRMRPAGYR